MKMVDTSCWIQALRRKGEPNVSERVKALLDRNEAAWCNIVRLELWRGARNDWDRQLLDTFENLIPVLAINRDTWQRSIYLSQRLRAEGYVLPLPDLDIFCCAKVHEVEIEHADKHFDLMESLFPHGV